HRAAEKLLQLLCRCCGVAKLAFTASIWKVEIPILLGRELSVFCPQKMAGRNLADALETGALERLHEKIERVVDGSSVRLRLNHSRREQAFDLGGPQQPAVLHRVEKWTNSDAIACQQELSLAPVPECYGELTARPREDLL